MIREKLVGRESTEKKVKTEKREVMVCREAMVKREMLASMDPRDPKEMAGKRVWEDFPGNPEPRVVREN